MNLETINKWLDEEYGCSYTRLEELHDWLVEENIKLKDKNQQLKKQKDDVVEDIKKQITFCTNEAEGTVNNEKCWMAVNYLKKILKMLGEIDE